jgi:hypothetical protein
MLALGFPQSLTAGGERPPQIKLKLRAAVRSMKNASVGQTRYKKIS